MVKRLYESNDGKKQHKKVSPKRKVKEHILKEGPGSAYTIRIKGAESVSVRSAKVADIVMDDNWVDYVMLDVDVDYKVESMSFYSYYYGSSMRMCPVHVTKLVAYYDDLRYYANVDDGDESVKQELYDLPKEELEALITDLLEQEHEFTIGGGYIHTKFNGELSNDDYTGKITDKDAVQFVDDAVSSNNRNETYRVVLDDSDIYESYEDKDEAIRVADELAADPAYEDTQIDVEFVTEYYTYDPETGSYDYTDDYTVEPVYSAQ
jgi:hypothetical protein